MHIHCFLKMDTQMADLLYIITHIIDVEHFRKLLHASGILGSM